MCTKLMRAAVLLLAAACAAQPARADARDCAAEAAAEFEALIIRRGDANVSAVIAAGCDGVDSSDTCAVRGTPGPCSNPACPANQISSFACTAANEANACCLEEVRKPCEGCELIITECFTRCDGPAPPAKDRFERAIDDANNVCANRADINLPIAALDFPDRFTAAGCDAAAPGVVCDGIGAFSLCEDLPLCAGVDIKTSNCTALTTARSCCTAFLAPPCPGCEPQVDSCSQQCLEPPPFPTGGESVLLGPALACAIDARSRLKDLALMNPDSFAFGCNDSDPFAICNIRSSVGSCESNPACPADQIDQGRCTDATGPPECCDVSVARPSGCEGCDPIPVQCQNVCASNSPFPELSAAERLRRNCIDLADLNVAALRVNSPDFLAPSCAAAEPGQPCEIEGFAGACTARSLCASVAVRLFESCSEAGTRPEDGCCHALVAPPCPGCTPEPVRCFQSCG